MQDVLSLILRGGSLLLDKHNWFMNLMYLSHANFVSYNMIFDCKLQYYKLIFKWYCPNNCLGMSKILDQLLQNDMKYFLES